MPQVMRNVVVLPAPLGPKQADDLAGLDLEVDAVDHAPAAVRFHQAANFKSDTCEVLHDVGVKS